MSNHEDYKAEIDAWADMWDEMQDKGVHPSIEKPKPSPFAAGILGDNPSDSYYDFLDGQDDLLSEEEQVVITQNPVRMDTVGSDNEQPKPAWVSEDLLDEIEKMKNRLFELENQAARMGQGKEFSEKPVTSDEKKFMSKFENIRKDIERISNELGVKNDPSPYKLKVKKS